MPESAPGGESRLQEITGLAKGAKRGQKIVLYAKSGPWWVQPFANKPFTDIRWDSTWKSPTHLGTEYAALLVDAGYNPPAKVDLLPRAEAGVVTIARVHGTEAPRSGLKSPKKVRFGGYEWEVRHTPGDRAGVHYNYDPSHAWTDARGWLHLKMTKTPGGWSCAELYLQRSLGYGTYSFVVQDASSLEPASVLGMYTWDDDEGGENYREIDIELSRWGDPAAKNAQFVIQPYYVPANVYRFPAPATPVRYSFRWDPGRVSFRAVHEGSGAVISEHVFTSGTPTPGRETVHLSLYPYGRARTPQQQPVEVVIAKFEYLP